MVEAIVLLGNDNLVYSHRVGGFMRPKGFVNPYSDKPPDSWERLCFERGADAYEDGLKKNALKRTVHVIDGVATVGYLVFVEEE